MGHFPPGILQVKSSLGVSVVHGLGIVVVLVVVVESVVLMPENLQGYEI